MCAWTPYAIVALMYLAELHVPHTIAVAAPFFAKSSTCYNPVITFLMVKRFRKDTKQLLCKWLPQGWFHRTDYQKGVIFGNQGADGYQMKVLEKNRAQEISDEDNTSINENSENENETHPKNDNRNTVNINVKGKLTRYHRILTLSTSDDNHLESQDSYEDTLIVANTVTDVSTQTYHTVGIVGSSLSLYDFDNKTLGRFV